MTILENTLNVEIIMDASNMGSQVYGQPHQWHNAQHLGL